MREPDSGRDLQLHQAVITRVISNFVEALTELVLAQQLRRVPIGVERRFKARFGANKKLGWSDFEYLGRSLWCREWRIRVRCT